MKQELRRTSLIGLIISLVGATTSAGQGQDLEGPAVSPQPRIEEWWFSRHAEKIGQMSKGEFDLLMVGDSITHNFDSVGESVWKKHFEPRKAINLGFGGDRTNHVLWRLDHLPRLETGPRAAVVMIGTNNICWGSDEPAQAAMGVAAVATKLRGLYPEVKVLVLGVFPRRREATHPHRKEIVELNAALPGLLESVEGVTFLDIGEAFLDEKGHLSEEMMPDTTHPSERGHEIWAEEIGPVLDRWLGPVEPEFLMARYAHLAGQLGENNEDEARITAGPERVELKRGQAPGQSWLVELGESSFRVSIEDVTGLEIEEALRRIERVPPLYLRAFEIVSEEGKDGVAFYADLGGAAAHGGQQYLNIIDRAGAEVMIHEAGHIMEQRARNTETDILDRWGQAIAADGVSISPYGDRVVHEDQAEFAKLYGLCLNAGEPFLEELRTRSPERYALWERMLELAKAR